MTDDCSMSSTSAGIVSCAMNSKAYHQTKKKERDQKRDFNMQEGRNRKAAIWVIKLCMCVCACFCERWRDGEMERWRDGEREREITSNSFIRFITTSDDIQTLGSQTNKPNDKTLISQRRCNYRPENTRDSFKRRKRIKIL